MPKSVMELTDSILNGALTEQKPATVAQLPGITDEQRDALLNESLLTDWTDGTRSTTQSSGDREKIENDRRKKAGLPPKAIGGPQDWASKRDDKMKKDREAKAAAAKSTSSSVTSSSVNSSNTKSSNPNIPTNIPVIPSARRQHTLQGLSKNTLGKNKPKKTMGTPPGFEKTDDEKAALKKNESLYPRITVKAESRERTQRGNAIRAGAARRRQRDGTGSTPASRETAAANFKASDDAKRAERSKSMAAAGEKTRADVAKRRASQTLNPRTGKPRTDGGPTVSTNNDSSKPQNSSITRKQYAVLKEARDILREVTSAGGIGMGSSANRAFDAQGPAMGKDTPPIKGVDKNAYPKMKKGSSKKVTKKEKAKKDKDEKAEKAEKGVKVKMENSSFERFLHNIVNETLDN